MPANPLVAVFWDHPEFLTDANIERALGEGDADLRQWMLLRFLRHGRIADTFRFFGLNEITRALPALRNTSYEWKKWTRLVQVYHGYQRG